MDFRIIKSPSQGTLEILERRIGPGNRTADIAEKTAGVTVKDIKGSCPQNMILLAIFGDTASVESAIEKIRENLQGEK